MTFQFPLSTLRQSVYATLVYFDLFDYPLTIEELERNLLGMVPSRDTLEQFLESEKKIILKDNHYFLEGREEILKIHAQRKEVAKKLWKKIDRFLPFIQTVPFLRMVAVCNTLAFDNPNPQSDIDLFIVTKKNRIFLARTITTLLFTILGIRRHGRKIAGRFCLSFYVTEDAVELKNIQLPGNDIYLAYWVKTLKPIYGEKNYDSFLSANTWIDEYFQHKTRRETLRLKKYSWLQKIAKLQESILKGKLGDLLETKLNNYQQKRHTRNEKNLVPESSVIISSTMLKFHNIDRRQEFSKRFHNRLNEILS